MVTQAILNYNNTLHSKIARIPSEKLLCESHQKDNVLPIPREQQSHLQKGIPIGYLMKQVLR